MLVIFLWCQLLAQIIVLFNPPQVFYIVYVHFVHFVDLFICDFAEETTIIERGTILKSSEYIPTIMYCRQNLEVSLTLINSLVVLKT